MCSLWFAPSSVAAYILGRRFNHTSTARQNHEQPCNEQPYNWDRAHMRESRHIATLICRELILRDDVYKSKNSFLRAFAGLL